MAEPVKIVKWPYISTFYARLYVEGVKIKTIKQVPERFRPHVIEVLLFWGYKMEDIK